MTVIVLIMCLLQICVSFLFAAIGVSFSQTTFPVNERDGVVTVDLTLSRPTPCCVHLYVEVEDITATSKL